MGRQFPFGSPRGCRGDHVSEGLVVARTAETTSSPLAQVVLNPALKGLSEHQPRLPHRPRHDADAGKFIMRSFGPVASAHGHGQSHNLAPTFQTRVGKRSGHDVGHQRIGRNHHISTGHQCRQNGPSPYPEERLDFLELIFIQGREARDRRPPVAVKGRRKPPDPTPARPQLSLLLLGVLMKPVGRIGHDGMNRIRGPLLHPRKAIMVVQSGLSASDRGLPILNFSQALLARALLVNRRAVNTPSFPNKQTGRIEPQIGPDGRCWRFADFLADAGFDQCQCQRRVGVLKHFDDGIANPARRLLRA